MSEVAFDQSSVDYVSRPADEAFEQGQAIALNETYAVPYKQEQVAALFKDAREKVEARYASEAADLEAKIGKLAKESRLPLSIPAEEVAGVLYVRDAIRDRARNMSMPEFKALWETAIADGDKLAIRALYDFGESLWRPKNRKAVPEGVSAVIWATERAKSEEALLSNAQRKARAELKRAEATRIQLTMARRVATERLSNGFRINPQTGELIDGYKSRAHELSQRAIRG